MGKPAESPTNIEYNIFYYMWWGILQMGRKIGNILFKAM